MAARRRKRNKARQHNSVSPPTAVAAEASAGMEPTAKLGTLVFYATTFLSAFLLFQIQPLVSKAILPWFGGSPAVWTTAMLFFQVLLLGGYCYAHLTRTLLGPRAQAILHLVLIGAAVVLLPIYPADRWKPIGGVNDPSWHILGLLMATVGVQFFLLSSTAPLIQAWWYSRTSRSPYGLYALSNTGSLLALLSYPLLVEPLIGVRVQAIVWSAAFLLLGGMLVGCVVMSWRSGGKAVAATAQADDLPRAALGHRAAWVVLAACGSGLLLTMTNRICQDIAVIPLLWIAPLSLYLLSFIICFGNPAWYRRGLFAPLMMGSMLVCAMLFRLGVVTDEFDNLYGLLAAHLLALFFGCMVCHGELVRIRPPARDLTSYYLMISVGGALGGVFVSLVAPAIFLMNFEYPIILVGCWLIVMFAAFRDKHWLLYRGRPAWVWLVIVCLFFYYGWHLSSGVVRRIAGSEYVDRNFYGVLTVAKARSNQADANWLVLYHGRIRHGAQYLDKERKFEPTTYYTPASGMGRAMRHLAGKQNRRIGVIGLGVGTFAVYAEPGDYFRCYEINPIIADLATTPGSLFTFWSLFDARGAKTNVVMGDARMSLENELAAGEPQHFDLLVIDAFSGDAVPIHLLTREAFEVYAGHLAPDGILAVHISNRYLDLAPVVRAAAWKLNWRTLAMNDKTAGRWILVGPKDVLDTIYTRQKIPFAQLDTPTDSTRLWTDDFSNFLGILY